MLTCFHMRIPKTGLGLFVYPYPESPYPEKKITLASSISVIHYSNWYINGKVFTSTTAWLIFNRKKRTLKILTSTMAQIFYTQFRDTFHTGDSNFWLSKNYPQIQNTIEEWLTSFSLNKLTVKIRTLLTRSINWQSKLEHCELDH